MKPPASIHPHSGAPLPLRDGVAPSRVYLPAGPWETIFDFLVARFPYISEAILRQRLMQGDVLYTDGVAVAVDSAYVAYQWLWYYRVVPDEPPVPFSLDILYRDERLVVVDKPHFLASIPGGRHLRETVLTRLRESLDLPGLAPIHRLDRDTAGVMLLCSDPDSRGAYQQLFQSRNVAKEYEAVAAWREELVLPCSYRSRLVQGEPYFIMQEAPGEPNSETLISLIEHRGSLARYCLRPITGRKHQLRVHMSALGVPICNDTFYPVCKPKGEHDNYAYPLQLLARGVTFTDPFTGQLRCFESRRTLDGFKPDARV